MELGAVHKSTSPRVSLPYGGQLMGLYGPSGVGKTRLLRQIAGLETSTNETIQFSRQPERVGMVFQDSALFPHLNVQQNLMFALRHAKSPRFKLADVCEWFALSSLLKRPVQGLSGGEQQRVAMARALLNNPDLLLLDEPVAALDPSRRQQMLQHLVDIQRQYQLPMLMVSHDLLELACYCQQLIVMQPGEHIQFGDVAEVLQRLAQQHQHDPLAILQGKVLRSTEGPGWRIDCAGQPVYLNLPENVSCAEGRVVIPAQQVSVSLQPLQDGSALNQVRVQVTAIRTVAPQMERIELMLGEQGLFADISSWQCQQLKLQVGSSVWAQFNGIAVGSG